MTNFHLCAFCHKTMKFRDLGLFSSAVLTNALLLFENGSLPLFVFISNFIIFPLVVGWITHQLCSKWGPVLPKPQNATKKLRWVNLDHLVWTKCSVCFSEIPPIESEIFPTWTPIVEVRWSRLRWNKNVQILALWGWPLTNLSPNCS